MVYVVVGIAVVVVALLTLVVAVRRVITTVQRYQQAVRDRYPDSTIHYLASGANFFGQESLGVAQGRGNGTLAVAEDEIYFLRWFPQKEFIVPLRDIESVEIVKSFLGKTVFRSLVKVNFRNEDGESDSIAWLVKDPYNLKELLEERIRGAS